VAYRPNYQILRDDHARAMDALDQHIGQSQTRNHEAGVEPPTPEQSTELTAAQDAEPTRPEDERGSSPGWTGMGGMPQQQASANTYNNWIAAELGSRDDSRGGEPWPNAEQSAANAALDQHIDDQERGGPRQEAATGELEQYRDRSETGDRQSEFQGAAREVLDRHIDSPEPQPDIQPQPDIDRDI